MLIHKPTKFSQRCI